MLWVSSDTHFGHANILRFCDRPFKDVDHMNAEIIKRFNEVLTPDDSLLLLGDVALGGIEKNLPLLDQIVVGKKFLSPGNHDACWIGEKKDSRREKFLPIYEKYFDYIFRVPIGRIADEETDEFVALINHFPYEGDSQDQPRYNNFRYPDEGFPLVHGHTHSSEKVSYTNKGTLQIHVGVDAWDFRPVSIDTLKGMIATLDKIKKPSVKV